MYVFRPDESAPRASQRSPVEPKSALSTARAMSSVSSVANSNAAIASIGTVINPSVVGTFAAGSFPNTSPSSQSSTTAGLQSAISNVSQSLTPTPIGRMSRSASHVAGSTTRTSPLPAAAPAERTPRATIVTLPPIQAERQGRRQTDANDPAAAFRATRIGDRTRPTSSPLTSPFDKSPKQITPAPDADTTPAVGDAAATMAVAATDSPIGLTPFQRFAKRSFDLASIVVILALFWWAIIAVWIAVRITTGAPVIYGHKRVGRGGREFKCYKFRSMVPNADEVLAHLLATDASAREEWAKDFKLKNDPRVTRVGRFIRKTSLDEFPQLWNVLVNDMSVVGPRPVIQAELDKYYSDSACGIYTSVKPGLTGPWQVGGRNDMDYVKRVALDCRYVNSWGLWSDFTIVMRTVSVMRGGKGAY